MIIIVQEFRKRNIRSLKNDRGTSGNSFQGTKPLRKERLGRQTKQSCVILSEAKDLAPGARSDSMRSFVTSFLRMTKRE